jgi:hypothetical protein
VGVLSVINHLLYSEQHIQADVISLTGPFLSEDIAIKNIPRYKECLNKTFYNVNCAISRNLLILSEDDSLESRDNIKMELGLEQYNHYIGLFVKSSFDFDVFELDNNILLNIEDQIKLKNAIAKYPPTAKELHSAGLC